MKVVKFCSVNELKVVNAPLQHKFFFSGTLNGSRMGIKRPPSSNNNNNSNNKRNSHPLGVQWRRERGSSVERPKDDEDYGSWFFDEQLPDEHILRKCLQWQRLTVVTAVVSIVVASTPLVVLNVPDRLWRIHSLLLLLLVDHFSRRGWRRRRRRTTSKREGQNVKCFCLFTTVGRNFYHITKWSVQGGKGKDLKWNTPPCHLNLPNSVEWIQWGFRVDVPSVRV